MIYTQAEWLLLFFVYSFFGWIWECCYVSAQKRQWVNRGFLYGPWLPIYGSGAIAVLWATLPVRTNVFLVFLLGMISATALEYVTGAVMERIFQMRYWDYTNMPLNIKGYVCLPASLAWGAFSVLMTEWVHLPIERLLGDLPAALVDLLSRVLLVLFAVDATRSIQAALDLKAVMEKLTNSRKLAADADMHLHEIIERMYPDAARAELRLKQLEESIAWKRERLHQRRAHAFAVVQEKSDTILQDISGQLKQAMSEQERSRLHEIHQSVLEFQESIRRAEQELSLRREELHRAASILRRNPGAVSRRHQEILDELRARRDAKKVSKE